MNESFKKYITIIYTAIVTLLVMCVFVWACDDFYFGKSQEEIEKEIYENMFEIDTTIVRIKLMLGDSSSVNK